MSLGGAAYNANAPNWANVPAEMNETDYQNIARNQLRIEGQSQNISDLAQRIDGFFFDVPLTRQIALVDSERACLRTVSNPSEMTIFYRVKPTMYIHGTTSVITINADNAYFNNNVYRVNGAPQGSEAGTLWVDGAHAVLMQSSP